MNRTIEHSTVTGIHVRTAVSAGSSSPGMAVTCLDDVKGAGDVMWLFMHGTGLYLIPQTYFSMTGNEHGCDDCQRNLNARFPLR